MLSKATPQDLSVVISTFNSPVALRKTLWGFQCQSYSNFEIVVSDDGSTSETAEVIEEFRSQGMLITHVWHEDRGFRKNRILNRAVDAAKGEYLIFTDGDCIPRSDFVESHLRLRKPDQFLNAGGAVRVPDSIHVNLDQEDVISGRAFDANWLKQRGQISFSHVFRLSIARRFEPLLNRLSHRPDVFTGNGSSAWRSDVLKVNGYDERVAYGGTDKEFGYRLAAAGVKCRNCRYTLVSLHLEHDRPYRDDSTIKRNHALMKKNRKNKVVWTNHGIVQQPAI